MKKGGGSESTIIIGPSKSVPVYALHSLEYVLGLARFRVFLPNIYIYNCCQKVEEGNLATAWTPVCEKNASPCSILILKTNHLGLNILSFQL